MVDDERTAYHKSSSKKHTCNRSFQQNQLNVRQKHSFNLKGMYYSSYSFLANYMYHPAQAEDDSQIGGKP